MVSRAIGVDKKNAKEIRKLQMQRDLCFAQDGREQWRWWPHFPNWHRRLMEMGRAASFALPRSTNGDIRDGTDFPPSGSYTVDPDCTGSFFDEDGSKTNNVVFDGRKRFFLLKRGTRTRLPPKRGEDRVGELNSYLRSLRPKVRRLEIGTQDRCWHHRTRIAVVV